MGFPKPVRTFNKYVTNPLLGRIARSAHGPFAIVYHVGRRSGKPYQTTIIVRLVTDGFLIALTYGDDVDWYRNIVAANGCRVLWHKREYVIDSIEPVAAEAAQPLFPQPERAILQTMGVRHFAELKFAVNQTSASGF